MRLFTVLLLFTFVTVVLCRSNIQKKSALTEVSGQEVIEIGAPIKELPPGMEEEPSAENDVNDIKTSINANKPVTKKEVKKLGLTTTVAAIGRKVKDVDKLDGVKAEDDDAKIERALSELYRDNADYKVDNSAEVTEKPVEVPPNTTAAVVAAAVAASGEPEQVAPARRANSQFQFQPDMDNKQAIERFRTSVDEISCDKAKLAGVTSYPDAANMGFKWQSPASLLLVLAVSSLSFLC